MADMLKGWGIAFPEPSSGGQGREGAFWGKLTAEQQQQLQARTKELRANNATREEIRAAIQEMLKAWGIEPGGKGGRGGRGGPANAPQI